MRKTYKQKESECCAERGRLRGEVICDDRMRNGKQRGRRGERESERRRKTQIYATRWIKNTETTRDERHHTKRWRESLSEEDEVEKVFI